MDEQPLGVLAAPLLARQEDEQDERPHHEPGLQRGFGNMHMIKLVNFGLGLLAKCLQLHHTVAMRRTVSTEIF